MSETIKATLARLEARLDNVESMIGHNNGGPTLDDAPVEDRRLSKRKLAERWGTSTRSVDRARKEDREFPAPERDYPGGPTYWWLSKIVRYERKRAARVQQPYPRSTEAARAELKKRRLSRAEEDNAVERRGRARKVEATA